MKFIKKLIEKLTKKKEAKKEESWYNNSEEQKKTKWNPTEEASFYDEHYHDMGVTNQIAKR